MGDINQRKSADQLACEALGSAQRYLARAEAAMARAGKHGIARALNQVNGKLYEVSAELEEPATTHPIAGAVDTATSNSE